MFLYKIVSSSIFFGIFIGYSSCLVTSPRWLCRICEALAHFVEPVSISYPQLRDGNGGVISTTVNNPLNLITSQEMDGVDENLLKLYKKYLDAERVFGFKISNLNSTVNLCMKFFASKNKIQFMFIKCKMFDTLFIIKIRKSVKDKFFLI